MFTSAALRPVLLASAIFLPLPAHALMELGFDDGEFLGYFSSIDHPSGVSFSVDPAGFASYGTGYVIGADFVQGAALELDPATSLTMRFSAPVNYLEFGVLLNDSVDFFSRVSVTLYTPSGQEALPFIQYPAFSSLNERRFTYLGDGVAEARIQFGWSFDTYAPLAVDNVVFQPVPEPASYALMATGLLVVAGMARCRPHA